MTKFYEQEKAEELKRQIIIEQNGICPTCGKLLTNPIELAHRIPKYKRYLKKYGKEVIHHRLNLRATHSGRCNDAVMINPCSHPVEAEELIQEILIDLKKDTC